MKQMKTPCLWSHTVKSDNLLYKYLGNKSLEKSKVYLMISLELCLCRSLIGLWLHLLNFMKLFKLKNGMHMGLYGLGIFGVGAVPPSPGSMSTLLTQTCQCWITERGRSQAHLLNWQSNQMWENVSSKSFRAWRCLRNVTSLQREPDSFTVSCFNILSLWES